MIKICVAGTIALLLTFYSAQMARAHQPFFEEDDTNQETPMVVRDPTISTAVYATLETNEDVDYFTFSAAKGSRILVAITIPQIEGQQEFAPTLAVVGPGLPEGLLPARIRSEDYSGFGAITIAPVSPRDFFEPYSRTSYWSRQSEYVEIPRDDNYIVVVWHDSKDRTGRYVLVIGEREVRGGDPEFASKIDEYWTPVTTNLHTEEKLSLWQQLFDLIRLTGKRAGTLFRYPK